VEDELAQYVEEVALFFEESGLPRIAGRILGLLLICDPPHRSAAELADEIGASKGSISTMTRMLVGAAMLERVPVPGDRVTYFQVRTDGFEKRFETLMSTIVGFQPLAARGLALLEGEAPERKAALRELSALYAFLEREIPEMLERWREERDALIAEEADE